MSQDPTGYKTRGRAAWKAIRAFLSRTHALPPGSILRRVRNARARRRLLRHLTRARKLAFVCSGNVIRSPFAAQYCQALVARIGVAVEIRSAGTYLATSRASPPPSAVLAAERWGVDLSQHRSKAATRQLVKWADVILVMDARHQLFLRERCPEAMAKVFFLAHLEDGAALDLDIPDPMNQPPEVLTRAYEQIAGAVQSLVAEIQKSGAGREQIAPGQ